MITLDALLIIACQRHQRSQICRPSRHCSPLQSSLSSWRRGDIDGRDEDAGEDDDGFDKCALHLLRPGHAFHAYARTASSGSKALHRRNAAFRGHPMQVSSVRRDTAAVVIRVITARATQKLLMQLSELDIHVAGWLSNYVSEHKPLEGNQVRMHIPRMPRELTPDTWNGGRDGITRPSRERLRSSFWGCSRRP